MCQECNYKVFWIAILDRAAMNNFAIEERCIGQNYLKAQAFLFLFVVVVWSHNPLFYKSFNSQGSVSLEQQI